MDRILYISNNIIIKNKIIKFYYILSMLTTNTIKEDFANIFKYEKI